MSLSDTIASIADNLRTNKYRNETDIREAVVNRILMNLGWDIFNPDYLKREFGTDERKRVDYALFVKPNSPSVFLEVKAPNCSGGGDRQLFEYAFHQGAPFAILVDGREWSFYLPGEQGTYLERRVHKLDLLERKAVDAASILQRYLAFERIKSGAALKDARSDYESAARERQAKEAIPRAWTELITEPDELLIELIAEKVVSLIGFRPIDEHVEEFLAGRSKAPGASSTVKSIEIQQPANKQNGEDAESAKPTRKVSAVLFGKIFDFPDAISALIHVLKELERRKPGFLDQFALAAPGKRRNHISKTRSEVYPNKPELEIYTTGELGDGWWLGTNIANRDKLRLIRIACEVANVKFGKDVQIALPNTKT